MIKLKSNVSGEFEIIIKALTFGIFLEEFFFRKLYIDSIMKYRVRVNINYIIILNIIFFRLAHFTREGISIQFILGASVYIICYLKFLDIRISILIHFLWNLMNLFFGYINRYNPYLYDIAKLSMNKNFQIIFEIISILFFITLYLYYANDLKDFFSDIKEIKKSNK